MTNNEIHVVTGAFGYSGKYIAERLLEKGHRVRTLTNSMNRENPFAGKIEAHPYHFDDIDKLAESLEGAPVLYNTYWVRFNHADFKQSPAVKNTLALFEAAKRAKVGRVVHISITNPSLDSPLEYFKGKAELEQALMESGLSYAVLRPAVLFGKEDILINNIAWVLRRLPIFGMFGNGRYKLQPIHVDDLAKLAVAQGEAGDNCIIDAIGPETFTYRELVKTIASIIGKTKPIIPVPDFIGYLAGSVIGKMVGDKIITKDEIKGLTGNLLYTDSPPAGEIKLTEWAKENAASLGRRYAGELARRKNRETAYNKL